MRFFSFLMFNLMLGLSPLAHTGVIAALQQGRFSTVIEHLEAVQHPQIDHLVYLATAYRALGLTHKALAALEQALNAQPDSAQRIMIWIHLSEVYQNAWQGDKAIEFAYKALQAARSLAHPLLHASALNSFGNSLITQRAAVTLLEQYHAAFSTELPLPQRSQLQSYLAQSQHLTDTDKKIKHYLALAQWTQEAQRGIATPLPQCDNRTTRQVQQPQLRQSLAQAHQEVAQLASTTEDNQLAALAYRQLGLWYQTIERRPLEAKAAFEHGALRAQVDIYERALKLNPQHVALTAKILINLVQLNAARYWVDAQKATAQLADGYEKALNQLTLARLGLASALPDVATLLTQALQLAQRLKNKRLQTLAYGQLAHYAERQQQLDSALQLTRKALFLAQEIQALDVLYRWQWQLGRLLATQGQFTAAIEHYQQAVNTLESIRPSLIASPLVLVFNEEIAPVYFELIALLLQGAAQHPQRYLPQVQATLERYKTVELENYFQDDCVTAGEQQRRTFMETPLPPKTAVLYPLLLKQQLALLVQLPQKLTYQLVPVTPRALETQLEQFLTYFDNTQGYHLYQWLIEPIEAALTEHDIDTLVIVPQGLLTQLPWAALYDGNDYLIQRYAFAVTPGLRLTQAAQRRHNQHQPILLAGLTTETQGLPKLCYVPEELAQIQALYEQPTQLTDQAFVIENIRKQLRHTDYRWLHFATHGEFNSVAEQSFILTYEHKMTLSQLEQLLKHVHEQPIELLTLSACQTAQGDRERAALGLAGVAVKAGVRSALASLWSINDQATAVLIPEFYRQLQQLPKAQALQAAQKHMLADPNYQHPRLWAAFLLIGHWL